MSTADNEAAFDLIGGLVMHINQGCELARPSDGPSTRTHTQPCLAVIVSVAVIEPCLGPDKEHRVWGS